MLNKEKFANRLQVILEKYNLTASSFADKIDVGRSSISHILSGRNNPSLEFIMKMDNAFPDLDLYWLIYGKERSSTGSASPISSLSHLTEQKQEKPKLEKQEKHLLRTDSSSPVENPIERVLVLYKDGRFKTYERF